MLFQMAEVLEWERLLLQSREVSALQGLGAGGYSCNSWKEGSLRHKVAWWVGGTAG